MTFKTWGYTVSPIFASDFRLGHYMKIPPHCAFWWGILCQGTNSSCYGRCNHTIRRSIMDV
ncbi:hypothetical protein BKA82DRAFT_4156220 [Pisolithus tinctorius]|nr:hypothetical protein BKA82DRAFT_4156220 [Pisolithus tinctorius]